MVRLLIALLFGIGFLVVMLFVALGLFGHLGQVGVAIEVALVLLALPVGTAIAFVKTSSARDVAARGFLLGTISWLVAGVAMVLFFVEADLPEDNALAAIAPSVLAVGGGGSVAAVNFLLFKRFSRPAPQPNRLASTP